MTHEARLNAHMRADTAGNKESRDDRAPSSLFLSVGGENEKKKRKKSSATNHQR